MIKASITVTCDRCGYTKTYDVSAHSRVNILNPIFSDGWEPNGVSNGHLCLACHEKLNDMIATFCGKSSDNKECE
jgi:hypothetical protein